MIERLSLLALLPLALAGCATTGIDGSLAGSTWHFTAIDGAAPVAPETSLAFGERLTANVGCNGLSGAWQLQDGRLVAGPLMATRMFCAGRMEQEQAVSALLSGNPAVRLEGDSLTLTSADRSAVLTRAPSPAP